MTTTTQRDLDYYTNSATMSLNVAIESYKPGPWIVAPPPQSATINALDAAVARYTPTVAPYVAPASYDMPAALQSRLDLEASGAYSVASTIGAAPAAAWKGINNTVAIGLEGLRDATRYSMFPDTSYDVLTGLANAARTAGSWADPYLNERDAARSQFFSNAEDAGPLAATAAGTVQGLTDAGTMLGTMALLGSPYAGGSGLGGTALNAAQGAIKMNALDPYAGDTMTEWVGSALKKTVSYSTPIVSKMVPGVGAPLADIGFNFLTSDALYTAPTTTTEAVAQRMGDIVSGSQTSPYFNSGKEMVGRVLYNTVSPYSYELTDHKIEIKRELPQVIDNIRNNKGVSSTPVDSVRDPVARMFFQQPTYDPGGLYIATGENKVTLGEDHPSLHNVVSDYFYEGGPYGGRDYLLMGSYKTTATPEGLTYYDKWDVGLNKNEPLFQKDLSVKESATRLLRAAVDKITTPVEIEGTIPWENILDYATRSYRDVRKAGYVYSQSYGDKNIWRKQSISDKDDVSYVNIKDVVSALGDTK